MNAFLIAVSLFSLSALIYAIRSLRIIGSKVSSLQTQQSKSNKELQREIRENRQVINRASQGNLHPYFGSKDLSWDFVLSLTSHAPRFHALQEVLEGLKHQVLQPQSIHLNIAREEVGKLPHGVLDLASSGFITITETDDLGPAKKLIPTLLKSEDYPIIVIDDDLTINPGLFLHLMTQHQLFPQSIIASRVHQVTINSTGDINPFSQWNKQYVGSDGPAADLMPTSGAGTLYPAGALHADAQDAKLYRELSDFTDDLWWYFQGRRKGILVRRISGFSDLNFIENTQDAGLWKNGNQDRNEANLLKLVKRYGNPLQM